METYILQWTLKRLGFVRKEVEVESAQDEWRLGHLGQRHLSFSYFLNDENN